VNALNKENEELAKYNLYYNWVSLELVALKKQREKSELYFNEKRKDTQSEKLNW
jgi:hypothetical protein